MKKVIKISQLKSAFTEKEKVYISLRNKEGRLLKDELVRELPKVPIGFKMEKEWFKRSFTFDLLAKYITNKKSPLRIMDLGCGNGWMSGKLIELGHQVTGIDLNIKELEQAARVFVNPSLEFLYADILDKPPLAKFDCIILASSIQYFQELDILIPTLLNYLNIDGEIIIMDSHFYTNKNIESAKNRSNIYFKKMEAIEMRNYYFHHSLDNLEKYNPKYIYKTPQTFIRKILSPNQSVFPILTITRK